MPSFYWEFCSQLRNDHNASEYAAAARPEYPLHTGEADRQRLMVTAEVYNAATTEFLRKFLPKTGRILEVGCGHGQIAQWLAANAPEATVIGLDNDAEQISLAKSAASAHGINNLSFRVGDLSDLASISQLKRKFELITCRFTLLHIGQRRPVVEALLGLLTPLGVLVVEEPSLGSLFCIPHVAGFEQANAAISAYGESRGVNYNCIEDIWSIITKMNVQIRDARFSQPTVWKKEHKALVKLSFQQLSPRLVAHGILEEHQAKRIEQSLDSEYMDDLVISGGLRTLQIAMSVKGRS
ncbi:class I SAM-dependent methyltransferase [Pandoraea apista]|nr:class I SAM-dependent methyltransferase [Pandoraea apista]